MTRQCYTEFVYGLRQSVFLWNLREAIWNFHAGKRSTIDPGTLMPFNAVALRTGGQRDGEVPGSIVEGSVSLRSVDGQTRPRQSPGCRRPSSSRPAPGADIGT